MAKATAAAIPVKYTTLVGLLGKQPDDPAVTAMTAKAGKVTVKSDFIVAKEAGFDYALSRPTGAKKKVLSTLFLFPEGGDKHRGYTDLPKGFAWSTRAELLAKLPAPHTSWKIGKGKVPVATDGVDHDTWAIEGYDVSVDYRDDAVHMITVTQTEAASGGQDFSTHPLHFSTKPADRLPDAELVGMALLVAWAADRFGLPAKHAATEVGKQLAKRTITPRTFLVKACAKRLSSLDFDPKLGDFLYEYLHHVVDDEGAREEADAAIAKLLDLEDPERRSYNDDYLATFADLENPFYVPDSWDAVDRIAPVIDARLADFEATGYTKPPKLALYEKAAKLRDKTTVEPARGTLPSATADAKLADDLVALIGRSLKDPEVKAVITRAGMPIGKKIDQQANPALGVSYMGTNMPIDGKKQLGVDAIWFFAAKQKSYVRGIGGEVEFLGYPAPLPRGLAFGDARAAVAKKLGKPKSTYEDNDYWETENNLRLTCEFANGKLVQVYFGTIKNY